MCDIVRYLLPLGSLTNLGITMNGRTAAHLTRKLRSHPLPEVQVLARQIHREVEKVLPTLVKYCDAPSAYREETPPLIEEWIREHWPPHLNADQGKQVSGCRLVKYNPDEREALWKIATAILYPHRGLPYEKVYCRVRWLDRAGATGAPWGEGRLAAVPPGCRSSDRAFRRTRQDGQQQE